MATEKLVIVLAFFFLFAVGLVAYRLIFHPLAGFPGPKLAAATQWYEFYYDVLKWPGGQYMFEIERMHEKYGPIVRVTPHEVHIKDAGWMDTLYTSQGKGIRNKFPPSAHMTGTPLGSFGTVEHDVHRRRRAAVSPFFSKKAILDFQPILQRDVDRTCRSMVEQTQMYGEAEMRANFLALATDAISDHAFGGEHRSIDLDLIGNMPNMLRWQRTIASLALLTPLAKQLPWLLPIALKIPVPCWMAVVPVLGRIVALSREMHRGAQRAIDVNATELGKEARMEGGLKQSMQHNLFHSLIHSKLPDSEKGRKRMAQEGTVVLAAGGETCARMISSVVYFVLSNSDHILPRLMDELHSVMPTLNSPADLLELEKLPWLTAIIKETLRIQALVVSRLPLVAPLEALKYGDFVIPPGYPVSMTLFDVLHDPEIFPNPKQFRPERWLPESGEEYNVASAFYVPFGRGTRGCVGINMGYAMLYSTVATLFRRYQLELSDVDIDRDIRFSRDCFIGEPRMDSRGINIKIAPLANEQEDEKSTSGHDVAFVQ